MELLSVNVAHPTEVVDRGRTVRTGIFKQPVPGRIMLRRLNLDGDGQADLENHGGEHKAVYAYPAEHCDFWRRELQRDDLLPGQFGENFTVRGASEEAVHIGDVFRVGSAVVQVSQPRAPCFKLGIRMGLPDFPKRFLASRRVGFYLRVLEEGLVGVGDAMTLERPDRAAVSVRVVTDLRYFDRGNPEGAARAATVVALSPSWRQAISERHTG